MSHRIDADKLILGNGDIINDGTIVYETGKIIYSGESEHAPTADSTIQGPVVMPGLWDCHAHFSGIKTPNLEKLVHTKHEIAALRCAWDAKEALYSGITTVREVGGKGIYLNQVISEGLIEGPRIYGSGKVLSTTGGHGDIHSIPLNALDHVYGLGELADGVAGCYKAVRKQIRNGAELIKFCASGGVMSEIDHPIHQQFSLEEQKAIVEEAARAELIVAAHCHGAPGIQAALEAGAKTIEHGTYLTEELAEKMVEKDAILVPTRYVIEKLIEGAEKMGVPEYAMNKLRKMYDQHTNAVKIAIDKGVTIAAGTDMFISGPGGIFRWGDNAEELSYLVKLGLSPSEAIVAATGNGPLTLGPRGPKSGKLLKDYDADILVLNKDPLDDIDCLSNRDNITHIIKSGKTIKSK